MNTFNIIGRLTKDPEVSTTDKGSTICKFTLAVKRPYSKTETDFFPFTAWRGQAEFISRYFKKGDRLAVIVTGYYCRAYHTLEDIEADNYYDDFTIAYGWEIKGRNNSDIYNAIVDYLK